MPPRPAGGAPMSQDDINQLILQMAQSSQQLTAAVASLTSSQSSFMRSAADADANIGLSKAHSLLNVELIAAQQIDNTVSNLNRSGLPAALRDTNPKPPDGYNGVQGSPGHVPLDPRHANTYGLEHHDATTERADELTAWHRNRGREIRQLEKQLPADGYMNTVTPTVAQPNRQHNQWEGHPLTLTGSLNEGDVRKGEFTMSKIERLQYDRFEQVRTLRPNATIPRSEF